MPGGSGPADSVEFKGTYIQYKIIRTNIDIMLSVYFVHALHRMNKQVCITSMYRIVFFCLHYSRCRRSHIFSFTPPRTAYNNMYLYALSRAIIAWG